MRGLRSVVWILLALACQACNGLATYSLDRARDLSDVVDVRYGTGLGLGLYVQATPSIPLGAGLGASSESYSRQWFGRKSVEMRDGLFAHAIFMGVEGKGAGSDWTTGSLDMLGLRLNPGSIYSKEWRGTEAWFQSPAGDPPQLDRFRFGATVFLPGVNGGIFLNLGEVVDFLTGLVGFDLMRDDGIPKFR
ncbi:MAG TPA: hypothetical protein VFY71_14085 [Planctomycetota bacterium]|nr:hypothetical protein [Planctomycetota bacterium]